MNAESRKTLFTPRCTPAKGLFGTGLGLIKKFAQSNKAPATAPTARFALANVAFWSSWLSRMGQMMPPTDAPYEIIRNKLPVFSEFDLIECSL